MKSFGLFSAAIMFSVVACASQKHDSNSEVASAVAAQAPKTLTLSRDDRPVDGALKEVSFTQGEGGKYTVTSHENYYDRLGGREVDTTLSIVEQANCTFKRHSVSTEIRSIKCERDMRPVDGALITVEVTKNSDGYAAKMTSKYYDRIKRKEVKKTQALGDRLAIKPNEPAHGGQMCTMIAGMAYNAKTGECRGFTNGCQLSELSAAGFEMAPEGKCGL